VTSDDAVCSFVADLIALAAWRCEMLATAMVLTREKEASNELVAGH
jgi:hypothetical protein